MIILVAALVMAPADQDPTPQNADSKVVCRTIGVTGTRLRSERVCKTLAEWTAYRQEARRHIDQIQNQRGTAVADEVGGI